MCTIAPPPTPAAVPVAMAISMAFFVWQMEARWYAKVLLWLATTYATLPLVVAPLSMSAWFAVRRDSMCNVTSKGPGEEWHWLVIAAFVSALPWAIQAIRTSFRPTSTA